jgi:hypothetical protein
MIVRAQVAVQMDSLFPRDALVITPHFSNAQLGGGADWQDFASDLASSMGTYFAQGNAKQVNVKIYDAQGTVPVLPVGDATVSPGSAPAAGVPREVALCLSYYSGTNTPRKRGRLYVPVCAVGLTAQGRPDTFAMTRIGNLAGLLADAGGADVDWVLFSRLNNAAYSVSNWWVDNEYDTVRSRGLRATDRVLGTVSE